jgi:NhaP-type Na+/H+ or K+/H+ antiporter
VAGVLAEAAEGVAELAGALQGAAGASGGAASGVALNASVLESVEEVLEALPEVLPSAAQVADSVEAQAGLERAWIAVLVLVVSLLALFGGRIARRSALLSEASLACLAGLSIGLALLAANAAGARGSAPFRLNDILAFEPAFFFEGLLPPIILGAAFSAQKERFFAALGTICSLGVLGTLVSFAVVGGVCLLVFHRGLGWLSVSDCLAVGAIMSATDSVSVLNLIDANNEPYMHSLVFGEGVINDAVAIVLMRSAQHATSSGSGSVAGPLVARFCLIVSGSLFVGLGSGLLSAYVTAKSRPRHSSGGSGPGGSLPGSLRGISAPGSPRAASQSVFGELSQTVAHETLFVILTAYAGYVLADAFACSGILTLFFSGLVISHYTLHNLTRRARCTVWWSIKSTAFLSEIVVFLYVGVASTKPGNWLGAHAGEAALLFAVLSVSVPVARALFVFPILTLANKCGRSKHAQQRLSLGQMVIVWWSGLFRGAVSTAMLFFHFAPRGSELANGSDTTILSAVLFNILFCTIVLGSVNKSVALWLSPPKDSRAPQAANKITSSFDEPDSFSGPHQPDGTNKGSLWGPKASPQLEMQLMKDGPPASVELGLPHLDNLNRRTSSDSGSGEGMSGHSPPAEIAHDLLHEMPVQQEWLRRSWLEVRWASFNKKFMEPTFGGKHA